MERRYYLSMDNNSKEAKWQEIEIEQGNSLSFANVPILKHTSICSKYVVVPYHTSYSWADFCIDVFDASGGDYECIIELGCGYGRNIFEIFYRGGARDVPYFGGEFTKSGVEIATKLAQSAPELDATFFHFNHLKPNLELIKSRGFKKVFVFTCHSIEQVAKIGEEWFDVVSGVADFVRCLHLEPYGFQAVDLGEVSREHFKFMKQQGWNENFYETLASFAQKGKIVLDDTVLEIGCADPFNPGSIACWHSV